MGGKLTKEALASALRLYADRIEIGECECMMVWAAFGEGKNAKGGPTYGFELRKFSSSDFGEHALDIVYLPAVQAVKYFRDEAVAHPTITVGEAAEDMLGPVPTPPTPQYSASTCDTWCEPYASEEGAITEAVGAWWDSYAEEDDREVEVEVGEIVWASPVDYLFAESVIESVIDNIDHNHSAFDGYDPIPSDHRDARGLPCIDPKIAAAITEELQPALREVLRAWWEKHDLPVWFEVPRSRTVKVRVKVDAHGDLAGWEVER